MRYMGPPHFAHTAMPVSDSLNNLAVLYDAMGRHAEAEELRKKAMAIHRRPEGNGLQPGQ